jgi:DNA repair protein RecO (recombination protein O)
MGLYRDEGVVLRTYKLGEADRIVVLMTAGRGKVRAVAKGIRRTKSRIGGRLEPPNRVSLILYEGRELDIVSQADTLDHYPTLREDLQRVTDALSLVEAVDQVAQEGEPNPALYRMLSGALRTLAGTERRPELLVAAFYWKLLALEGVTPVLDYCTLCGPGVAVDLVSFDPVEGGALCRDHRRGTPVDEATLAVVRRILGGDLAAVLAEPVGATTGAVSSLATGALEAHLERRLRAVHLLGHTT